MATMPLFTDLHIHSKYARACSKDLDLAHLEKYARIKGVDVLGTGDILHPKWQAEVKAALTDDGTSSDSGGAGIYRSTSGFPFILQTELSFMYSQGGKGKRVHLVVLFKNLDIVEQATEEMLKHGRLDYDGRPVFGMPCVEFVERMMQIDKDIEIIPAHIWTPWFSLFGSNSGFDSIKDCFQDKLHHIHAVETGLSSDPPMNWRLSQLDKFQIVSFSDSHSFWPWRMGREATMMDIAPDKLSYNAVLRALRTGEGLAGTLEVDPNYGKYHLDGHRACGVCFTPSESALHRNICPSCKSPLTIGVLNRVEKLADRPIGFRRSNALPYHSMLPLSELISASLGKGVASRAVGEQYSKITAPFGSELRTLLEPSQEELEQVASPTIASLILKNRAGALAVKGGYDGVYGKLVLDGKQPPTKRVMPVTTRAEKQAAGAQQKRAQRGLEEWAG